MLLFEPKGLAALTTPWQGVCWMKANLSMYTYTTAMSTTEVECSSAPAEVKRKKRETPSTVMSLRATMESHKHRASSRQIGILNNEEACSSTWRMLPGTRSCFDRHGDLSNQ